MSLPKGQVGHGGKHGKHGSLIDKTSYGAVEHRFDEEGNMLNEEHFKAGHNKGRILREK